MGGASSRRLTWRLGAGSVPEGALRRREWDGHCGGVGDDGVCAPEDRMLDFIVLDAEGDVIVVYDMSLNFVYFLMVFLPNPFDIVIMLFYLTESFH